MGWSRLDLGVGLIAAGGVDLLWPGIDDLVDVIEVEPQTLWDHRQADGRHIGHAVLQWLHACDRPLLSHGVGFPVGGTVPPDADGVHASAQSARDLDAQHWSEHLSFNRAGPPPTRYAGYLLPPIPTDESADAAVSHIARFQDRFDRPFLVETPTSYLRPVPGDLTDGQFVADIATRADCGILLDLHNIWANERNGRQPVAEFLAQIPLERVWEVHLAGGHQMDSYYLDAHVGPVPDALLDLAAQVIPTLPRLRAILFEAVPESVATLGMDGIARILEQLHGLARLPEAPPLDHHRPEPVAAPAAAGTTAAREAALLRYTTRAVAADPVADPGADILRHLTDHARLSLLVADHAPELAHMLTGCGRAETDRILREFLAATPASAWPHEQSNAFSTWLDQRHDRPLSHPYNTS